jgi:uncharacterized protein (DUF1330 family)
MAAKGYWIADPTYHEAAKIRHAISEGATAIVEGYDGTQDF